MKRKKMVPVLVGLLVCSVLVLSTCGKIQDALDKWTADASAVGVYVGVFSYDGGNNNANNILSDLVKAQDGKGTVVISASNSSLAYLDSANNNNIKEHVLSTTSYKKGDTNARPLLLAVSKVIDNLKASENKLNAKLDNVTIVSFSSGRDQGSPDFAGITGGDPLVTYGQQIQNKILTTTIKSKPINAYSVIRVEANLTDEIKRTAQYVTSGQVEPGKDAFQDNPNILVASNLTETTLTPIFEGIAGSLPGIKQSQSVTITITGPGNLTNTPDSEGCNFCAVFNGKTPTEADVFAIKGFVAQKSDGSGKYQMTSIKYKNIPGNFIAPSQVDESTRNGIKVGFNFAKLGGIPETIKQYSYDGSTWNEITGANTSSDITVIKAEKKTAIVVLLLDAAMTNDADITNVRNAAKAFIQKLYDQSLE